MPERDSVRDELFRHSDSRPCRLVWTALDDTRTTPDDIDLRDYVEVLRVTDGAVCLVAGEKEADLYVRWEGRSGQFVYVAFWPPWGVIDAGATDRGGAVELLGERDDPTPVHVSETPFGNDGPAADVSELV